MSKANVANKSRKEPFKKILREVNKLSPQSLFKLTRAFNHFMNFYNLAESIDASRTLDQYENIKSNKKFQNIFIEENCYLIGVENILNYKLLKTL